MEGIETLSLRLDENETMALAQFVKRVSWSDLRGCAVSDEEAWVMRLDEAVFILYANGKFA